MTMIQTRICLFRFLAPIKLMKLSQEELKKEWAQFRGNETWYCPECDAMLSVIDFPECDGKDPSLPIEDQAPHAPIKASTPMTFADFCVIMDRWFEPLSINTSADKKLR